MRRPTNKFWDTPETEYIGNVGEWTIWDCTHFKERATDRVESCSEEEARFKAQTIFAACLESLLPIGVFMSYAKAKAWTLNRSTMEWTKARFEIRDQINHLAFIFEMRFDLHEVYLVTVMNPQGRVDVAIKSGVISFDIAPMEEAAEGLYTSVVTMRDWLSTSCKTVASAAVDASGILWEE